MTWKEVLGPVLQSQKMQDIKKFLQEERKTKNIYPAGNEVFRAFELTPYENTKVVILGEEPYCTPGTADGLAYSTKQKERPPMLEVIFKEIYKDLNIQYYHNETFEDYFPHNNLDKWAARGILLLNSTLTVEESKPNSHDHLGWDMVVKAVIEGLNQKDHQVMFILWGEKAQSYKKLIDPKSKHVVFSAAHPSVEVGQTEENGFYGCRHFSIIRDVLPEIEGRVLFPSIGLNACFDKEKAKEIVKTHYPIDVDTICKYIDEELIIHVPINKKRYWNEVRRFEQTISTKNE